MRVGVVWPLAASLWIVSILTGAAWATNFGTVRGIVHDPQHRPVSSAEVRLQAAAEQWSRATQSNADGEFEFAAVPLGDYVVAITAAGFEKSEQNVTVLADSSPVLHFLLEIPAVRQTATVSAQPETVSADSATPTTLVSRQEIARTPGADRTNSLQMITDFVPGAYMTHDQLHVRGGHQQSWLIDGVAIPNTNIASNLGPQIDPKNIDYLDIERGSYEAGYGDRTYGVFDVVPRTGFERNNEAELVTTLGNWYQTNDQLSFGSHTEKLAYYASVNGNRSNLGLETPVSQVFHDAENGYGGFGTLLYNATPRDQFRVVGSLRKDFYQVPYDPNPNAAYNSSGLRDSDTERDGYLIVSWVRTINPNLLLSVSPFYHYNSAAYSSPPNDTPIAATDDRQSQYGGLQATLGAHVARNDLQFGVYGFGQRDSQLFGAIVNNPSGAPGVQPPARIGASGGLAEEFADDKFKATKWLTLMAGVRVSHFAGEITEDAASPRVGVAFLVPGLHWAFRAFYGRYYQPPPLLTVSGPLLEFASSANLSFVPLHGERDEEHQFGVTIPLRGWQLDADTFETRANNFFDHNNVGESNIFIPVTIEGALIQAWELTLRSPRLWNRGQAHLAYSNQLAQGRGGVTGGLICTPPSAPACQPPPGYYPLDHDQRNTLNAGADLNLPWSLYASGNVYYGSGFTNGLITPRYPGAYLPSHTTVDLSVGKSFGERYAVSVTALNVGNLRVLLDNSLTFGGFHSIDPREIYAEFRYRFHY